MSLMCPSPCKVTASESSVDQHSLNDIKATNLVYYCFFHTYPQESISPSNLPNQDVTSESCKVSKPDNHKYGFGRLELCGWQ